MKINFRSLIIILSALFFFASCSKEKIDENTYQISYKLIGSEGVKIQTIKYNTDDSGGSDFINVDEETEVSSFESITYSLRTKSAYIYTLATGPNANSTLTAQIFKNGVMVKEYTRKGVNLGLELGLP
ncbi:MAG TPA: hypothetical protein PKE30_16120 [Niabella sp.]|nr:hypothetical protein [Niabella sp.]